ERSVEFYRSVEIACVDRDVCPASGHGSISFSIKEARRQIFGSASICSDERRHPGRAVREHPARLFSPAELGPGKMPANRRQGCLRSVHFDAISPFSFMISSVMSAAA